MCVQSAILGKINIIFCDLDKKYKKIINPSVLNCLIFVKILMN